MPRWMRDRNIRRHSKVFIVNRKLLLGRWPFMEFLKWLSSRPRKDTPQRVARRVRCATKMACCCALEGLETECQPKVCHAGFSHGTPPVEKQNRNFSSQIRYALRTP